MKVSSLLLFMMWEVLFERLRSVQILTVHFPQGLDASDTSLALTAQYLNVRQHKLGTIIIQTVHILQHESADIGSLLMRDFCMANSNYFL